MICGLRTLPRSTLLSSRLNSSFQCRAMSSSLLPPRYILTPHELHTALSQQKRDTSPRIIPVHAAWFMPNDPAHRTGASSFNSLRIPGARFFDLDVIKHPDSPYPHMLPTPAVFADAMQTLGISPNDTVVCYDSEEVGLFSAPRAAWTFRQMAHPGSVHVLDNFKVWTEAALPIASGPETADAESSEYEIAPKSVTKYDAPAASSVAQQYVDYEHVRLWAKRQVDGPREDVEPTLIDARPAGRFDGSAPEPRPGLPSGHVPGSVSVPFTSVLDPTTKTILPKERLVEVFKKAGVSKDNPAISACGTGVTAAIIDLALMRAGWTDDERKLYDGSWTEWAQRATEAEGLIVKS
ncbi:hypothetical protein FH972_020996 [Carpinus fangiana]|uniref:Rhodanese domain-containing protein n=1 Tax=Carpinus fangiana TaxID=176857 RepID=A0A5N6KNM0_9ROSI|nr:hypothetical protein FH972_020996 [Carpinus fangiana]